MRKSSYPSKKSQEPVTCRVTLTGRPRPRRAKSWIAAGYIPADRVYGEFPADLLPEIASIHMVRRIGEHRVAIELNAQDLSEDERFGLSMRNGFGLITYEEAQADAADFRRRFLKAI